jgi:hypothetical protein
VARLKGDGHIKSRRGIVAEREILGYGEALGMVYDYSLYMQLTPDFILRSMETCMACFSKFRQESGERIDTIRKRPGRTKRSKLYCSYAKSLRRSGTVIGALCEVI